MLAYAQKVRMMAPAELNQEVSRLGAGSGPTEQMQLSLVLSQLSQLPERIRAQELLARVLANPGAEAQELHALAGLLASRYAELRRLEEQLDKQTQQTREVQRRLDQTTERLEALKAIERSLTSRPPATGSSAPANRANRAPRHD
jgi:DNA repair ATPase RecN